MHGFDQGVSPDLRWTKQHVDLIHQMIPKGGELFIDDSFLISEDFQCDLLDTRNIQIIQSYQEKRSLWDLRRLTKEST
jgi:hypothetical protein